MRADQVTSEGGGCSFYFFGRMFFLYHGPCSSDGAKRWWLWWSWLSFSIYAIWPYHLGCRAHRHHYHGWVDWPPCALLRSEKMKKSAHSKEAALSRTRQTLTTHCCWTCGRLARPGVMWMVVCGCLCWRGLGPVLLHKCCAVLILIVFLGASIGTNAAWTVLKCRNYRNRGTKRQFW